MARLAPFCGTTYDPATTDPESVVSPPYDVVGPAERAALAARSAYNAIHVELPEDPGGGDRYAHAARLFEAWHGEGAVKVADQPTFYLYRMTFTSEEGVKRVTTGLLGALSLDRQHTGQVLPHEETTSKDRSDRLSLLRAARTNFSPIWGLSLSKGLGALCEEAAGQAGAPFAAHDGAGNLHELWAVTDPAFAESAAELVGTSPVLIADGHHRYDTACAFAEEDGSEGAEAILALVIELSEDQLNVEAIHRLIAGVDAETLREHLEGSFEVRPGPATAEELRLAMQEVGALGFLTTGSGTLLIPRDSGEELDSVRLQEALDGLPGAEVTFQHGLEEISAALAEGRAEAAVLIRPVSVPQIAATAHGGRRMPPKSTFFYPKLLTGMVYREIDAG